MYIMYTPRKQSINQTTKLTNRSNKLIKDKMLGYIVTVVYFYNFSDSKKLTDLRLTTPFILKTTPFR